MQLNRLFNVLVVQSSLLLAACDDDRNGDGAGTDAAEADDDGTEGSHEDPTGSHDPSTGAADSGTSGPESTSGDTSTSGDASSSSGDDSSSGGESELDCPEQDSPDAPCGCPCCWVLDCVNTEPCCAGWSSCAEQ